MMNYPRVSARIFNTPLLTHPGKAAAILAGLGGRLVDGGVEFSGATPVKHLAFAGKPSLGTLDDRLGRDFDRMNRDTYVVRDNIAIINIEGSLVHKGAWLDMDSGETSYQGIQTQVLRAARDAKVKGVVFEIDSYGGEVSGAYETAEMIGSLSQIKPTLAVLSDEAYSAGYLLAAPARQVIVPESGGAGSIGVVTLHTDISAALEMRGMKVTILAAGKHKADGNSLEPLPEDVATAIMNDLHRLREMFARAVAKYRGSRLSFDQAMETEADVFMGEDAVKRGLADAIGHPSDAFQAFSKAVNRA